MGDYGGIRLEMVAASVFNSKRRGVMSEKPFYKQTILK
jgi:hypothetical protein